MTTFRLAEPGSPEISVENSLVRGPQVRVDGQPVRRARQRGRPFWPIRLASGEERRMLLVGGFVGLRALVDGREYPIERRLAVWELLVAFLPIALISVGGILGGVFGAIAIGPNLTIMRRPWPASVRVMAALGVGVVATLAWIVLASLIVGALNRPAGS